jgi:hypothetical protein
MEDKNIQKQAGILGAASLAVVVSLLSMPRPLPIELVVASYLAAVALPLNVALFLSPDLSDSKAKIDASSLARWHIRFYLVAFPSAFVCVAALFWHVCVPAGVVFLCLSCVGLRFLFSIRRAKQEGRVP